MYICKGINFFSAIKRFEGPIETIEGAYMTATTTPPSRRMMADVFQTPICHICLLSQERVWFRSSVSAPPNAPTPIPPAHAPFSISASFQQWPTLRNPKPNDPARMGGLRSRGFSATLTYAEDLVSTNSRSWRSRLAASWSAAMHGELAPHRRAAVMIRA